MTCELHDRPAVVADEAADPGVRPVGVDRHVDRVDCVDQPVDVVGAGEAAQHGIAAADHRAGDNVAVQDRAAAADEAAGQAVVADGDGCRG